MRSVKFMFMRVKSLIVGILFGILSFAFWACSSDKKDAQKLLDEARGLYKNGDYILAKKAVDSLKTLYPKAFTQINASFALVDSIRKDENNRIISRCDSLMRIYNPVIDSVKQFFIYQRNKEFQEKGFYISKDDFTGAQLSYTTLRSGVDETDGQIYIESVFIGKQIHNKIKVSLKDGSFAESLPVNGEGLNFRFSNMGKQYEIIKFAGNDENGVAAFIAAHFNAPITVFLSGEGNYLYTLSKKSGSAINKAYELSVLLKQLDSLKTEKEKAQYRLRYIETKGINPVTPNN